LGRGEQIWFLRLTERARREDKAARALEQIRLQRLRSNRGVEQRGSSGGGTGAGRLERQERPERQERSRERAERQGEDRLDDPTKTRGAEKERSGQEETGWMTPPKPEEQRKSGAARKRQERDRMQNRRRDGRSLSGVARSGGRSRDAPRGAPRGVGPSLSL
jgi:hypothetical protein